MMSLWKRLQDWINNPDTEGTDIVGGLFFLLVVICLSFVGIAGTLLLVTEIIHRLAQILVTF